MNEIKFRAWLIHEQEMCMVSILDIRDRKAFIVRKDGCEGWRIFSEINLQQYTGEYERNSRQMCQGDVVQYSGSNGWDTFEIIFENGCFITRCITSPGTYNNDPLSLNSLDFKDHWEIIGNRYQNPELLKGYENENE